MKANIKNIRTGEFICKSADVLANSLSRTLGLMGKRKTGGVLFKLNSESRVNSTIHMGFMLMSIDVVWMNRNGVVVDIRRKVKPLTPFNYQTWKLHTPKKPASFILELPESGARNVSIGDVLHIDYLE